MQIVLARLVDDARVTDPGRPDLGRPAKWVAIKRPEALMWLVEGTGPDLEKAQHWAAANGYRVFVYTADEACPLDKARTDVWVG